MTTPKHYEGLQPLEVMQAWMSEEEYRGFLYGNVLKYLGRYKRKGIPLEDLKKAADYLNMLIEGINK